MFEYRCVIFLSHVIPMLTYFGDVQGSRKTQRHFQKILIVVYIIFVRVTYYLGSAVGYRTVIST